MKTMEPVFVSILYTFFGYYIGTDLYNYYKNTQNHNEIMCTLKSMERELKSIRKPT
jgi:hypothetical protein